MAMKILGDLPCSYMDGEGPSKRFGGLTVLITMD